MRGNFFAIIFLVSLTWLSCFSQEYHYASLYNVSGPVKEIKTNSKSELVEKKVKISKDGRGGISMMMYNNQGYPMGFELSVLGKENFQRFFYDEHNRIDSVSVKIHGFGKPKCIYSKHIYEGGIEKSEIVTIVEGKRITRCVFSFYDYSFDSHNNWLSRSVIKSVETDDGTQEAYEYKETRAIKYYSEKELLNLNK